MQPSDKPHTAYLPLGVCALEQPWKNGPRSTGYTQYIHEILGHVGLAYTSLTTDEIADWLEHGRILVTVGEQRIDDALLTQIESWLTAGGAWLSIGGLCGAGKIFGACYSPASYTSQTFAPLIRTLGEGYLEPGTHRLFEHLEIPLHFFNGLAVDSQSTVLARGLDAHGRPNELPLVIENGNCLLLAPDVVGTIVYVQQGRAVTRDGIPAPDGTGSVTDGWLKADDGMVVDWDFDRQEIPGVAGLKGFLQPVADAWREVILRAIFYLAEKTRTPLAILWFYPRNLPAVAHMSHDSDENTPEHAGHLLKLLGDTAIKSTWCIIPPGYEPEIINAIRDNGHELAMHYDAIDNPWSHDEFIRQWDYLKAQFGATPVTNKNHYTRWEGDCEFFGWCCEHGIQLDQSKGVSKLGSTGYNFGTCHPYFPVAPDGSVLDVLEMNTVCQDLGAFAPLPVGKAILERTLRFHGLFHMLFHPAHTHKPEVDAAFREIVALAKSAGLEWWRADEINTWERARRTVTWSGNGADILLHTSAALVEATLLVFGTDADVRVNGEITSSTSLPRWGSTFAARVLDLNADSDYRIQIQPA